MKKDSFNGVRCGNPGLVLPDEPDINDTSVLKKILASRTFELWAREREIESLKAQQDQSIKKTSIGEALKFLISVVKGKF